MKIKQLLVAAAISALTAVPAFAGVAGMADLNISQLLVVDGTTHLPTPTAGNISILTDTRTGTAQSNFNGIEGTGGGLGSITQVTFGGVSDVNVQYRCAGPSCAGINALYPPSAENNTTVHHMTNVGDFALADMNIQGNALTGSGASGLTRANASIDNGGTIGGANATIQNGVAVRADFAVNTTANLALALTYDTFVRVFVDALLPPGVTGTATAGVTWRLTLIDTTTGSPPEGLTAALNWSPSELNRGLLANAADQTALFQSAGTIFSESRTLFAGHTYSLVIDQASNSSVAQTAVPEPGSLLLVGAGLLGLGTVARRRKQG